MKNAALFVLSSLGAFACSAPWPESTPSEADAGVDARDLGPEDASPDGFGPKIPIATVYAVHAAPDLAAFRVCLDPGLHPLPSDPLRPMPLSNYPGVSVGGAASLGRFSGLHHVKIYPALQIADSSTDHDATCGAMQVVQGEDLGDVTFDGGIDLLVVRTGANNKHVVSLVSADSTEVLGLSLRLQLGDFSDAVPTTLAATFGKQSAAGQALGPAKFGALAPIVTTSLQSASAQDVDDYGVNVGTSFYSLANILRGTDPTLAPTEFFSGRQNGYAILLVGDATKDGGAGEHFVAIRLAR